MDYKKIYDSLITSRLSMKDGRKIEKKNGSYFERHHIVPISLGGDRSYALSSANIVLLTAREHYLAHRMLWLIYKTREMGFAFHKMVFSSSPLQERRFDSRAYEAAKIALSECQRGENNPMYGKESPAKGKSNINKGKKMGPDHTRLEITIHQKDRRSETKSAKQIRECRNQKAKKIQDLVGLKFY